jgi:predicted PurR-regulated permease PerM
VQLAWQTVVVVLAAVSVLLLLATVVDRATDSLTVIVIAAFLALALDPVVSAVQRATHVRRAWAVAIVLVFGGVLIAVLVGLAEPQLSRQGAEIQRDFPKTLRSLDDLPLVGRTVREHQVPQHIENAIGSLPRQLVGSTSDLENFLRRLAIGTGTLLVGGLLVAAALLDGPMLLARARGAVPVPNRGVADQIGRVVYDVLARYFAGSLLLAFLHGVEVAITGVLFGIPLTPALAVWAAITSLIPQVGGFLGFAVIVFVSLTQGVGPAIAMGVLFFLYMTFNNNVLTPLVVGHAVRLSPPVTMVAALAGFSVAGVVGSLLAVPTIGAIKAVTEYLRHRDDPDYRGPGSKLGALPARRRRGSRTGAS